MCHPTKGDSRGKQLGTKAMATGLVTINSHFLSKWIKLNRRLYLQKWNHLINLRRKKPWSEETKLLVYKFRKYNLDFLQPSYLQCVYYFLAEDINSIRSTLFLCFIRKLAKLPLFLSLKYEHWKYTKFLFTVIQATTKVTIVHEKCKGFPTSER